MINFIFRHSFATISYMQNTLKYLLRIILSIFINIILVFLTFLLIYSFYANQMTFGFSSFLVVILFGFWNGLTIGLIPFKFVRTFRGVLTFSFLLSFINSVFWVLFIISINKITGATNYSFDSFIILMVIFFGIVCAVPNLFSLFILNKIPFTKHSS